MSVSAIEGSVLPKNQFRDQTVLRQAMVYGVDIWAMKKARGKKFDVVKMMSGHDAEMGMWSNIAGYSVRNEIIRMSSKGRELM